MNHEATGGAGIPAGSVSMERPAGEGGVARPVPPCLLRDQFVKHCGIELLSAGPGTARTRVRLKPHHWNGLGMTQGGLVFTLADYTFAVASNFAGTIAVAISCTIHFMKATSEGVLTAECHEVSRNPRLGTYEVKVRDEAGEIVAIFEGLAYCKKDPLPA
jgi:acyl-CoA thioesterase